MKINLIEYFEETVDKCPQKIAVIDKERNISFIELSKRSKLLAANILLRRDVVKQPVAVYLNKSIESVCADLAIIYSGNFYMNLDVKTPSERIKNIIDLISHVTIITNNQYFHIYSLSHLLLNLLNRIMCFNDRTHFPKSFTTMTKFIFLFRRKFCTGTSIFR